jgi:hypothetical protein
MLQPSEKADVDEMEVTNLSSIHNDIINVQKWN